MNDDKDYKDPEENKTPEEEKTDNQDQFEVEKEWAERLKMNFDSEKATPPPAPEPQRITPPEPPRPTPPPYVDPSDEKTPEQSVPPVYVMPPGTELPPHQPHRPMPPTYMVWSILATICCCLPAGVVAIFFSSQVSSKYYARDYEGAERASKRAEMWIIASIVVGIIVNALYLPLSLMMPK